MSATIITTDDLREFKLELRGDPRITIKTILNYFEEMVTVKEVRELLGISPAPFRIYELTARYLILKLEVFSL